MAFGFPKEGGKGLSPYPHPLGMPHFWETASGASGVGPLLAIYQCAPFTLTTHKETV